MSLFRTPLSKLVARRREAIGCTQEELDSRIGMKPGYIAKLEAGKIKRPGPQVLVRLEVALGISRLELNQAIGHMPEGEDTIMYELERLARLPDDERAAALDRLPAKWQTILRKIAGSYLAQASRKVQE